MLRSEIQEKTGLTRKAIVYYEERGLIKPQKAENGYRDFSEEDLEILTKISFFRRAGLTVAEIEECLDSGMNGLSSILRRKQQRLEMEEKRNEVLAMMIEGAEREKVIEKLKEIEKEEKIFEKFLRAFPGYFGQMFFISYQPFLSEPLREEEAYHEYVEYLDGLPLFELTKEEKEYLEEVSSPFDAEILKKVNDAKISAVENLEKWWKENKEAVEQYEQFKGSEEYLNSPMKRIQDKLQKYMEENRYYEIAIPLMRRFSRSYDEYYEKLMEANEVYKKMRK